MTLGIAIAATIAMFAWIYLLLFRDLFWLADQRLPRRKREAPATEPAVVAVVPARNEAAFVGETVQSLLDQDYGGPITVLVVDDHSTDGTADAARDGAARSTRPDGLTVVAAGALPTGWTGKLAAMACGLDATEREAPEAAFVLFTDADIVHDGRSLRKLVAKAEAPAGKRPRVLVSLMVRLHCRSAIERLLIPAFVFFFQKLYPFRASNNPRRPVAAAAGGCMLVRRSALEAAGGLAPIKDALIDDCALAALLKRQGPIWLGLANDETRSIRPYEGLRGIWDMVARTAYTQLRHSPLLLLGTVIGMALLYIAPPLAVLWGIVDLAPAVNIIGLTGLLLMWIAYLPTWRLYGGLNWAFFALPVAAALYTAMTISSAWRHIRGRGGGWKGRTYAKPAAR